MTVIDSKLNERTSAIDIGDRRELFIDHHLIAKLADVRLVLHQPNDQGEVLAFNEPWEGRFCTYATVIRDGEKLRMYYRGTPEILGPEKGHVVCCAESTDGLRWQKPDLGLFESNGRRDTNIVLSDEPIIAHNFSPFLDGNPNADAEQRYKALGGTKRTGLIALASSDGIRWRKMREQAVIPRTCGAFDSQNVAFWSPSERLYVCYFRTWGARGVKSFRNISRTTSEDFLHWSPPVEMTYRQDQADAPIDELYINQTHPYFRAPHIYIATAARFKKGRRVLTDEQVQTLGIRQKDREAVSDAVLMTTRGGDVYHRTFLDSFIPAGIGIKHWVARCNFPALNVVQTGEHEMSVYVVHEYGQTTSHIRRHSMRLDGFASVRADRNGGMLTTHPVTFTGRHLHLNFATSVIGSVKIEFQEADGTPIPGFTLNDACEQIGNEIDRTMQWKGGTDVSSLIGKAVRLRFALVEADLYSFRFTNAGA